LTFKDGLLKARGQITFIIALTLSTGFIIYLETLDTETRIQGQVAAELSRQRNAPASIMPSTDAAVRANLQRSEEAFASAPEAVTNRAALLVSLSSAVQLGILKPEDGFLRVQRVLSEIERHRGEMTPVLIAALGATAVAFPSLQDRIGRIDKAP
jgi:hypothetical protein